MEDILLSQKQYYALLNRLNEINSDVTSIKVKSNNDLIYLDNYDLIRLLQVSNRTIQRWRRNGSLPFSKIGKKFYYRIDYILSRCKVAPDPTVGKAEPPPAETDLEDLDQEITCKRCPLFLMLDL
ncbi:MAG: helix-turn-helix domain-containing protein [Bacteroidetes bacterium]|nr:helix-turn-helix domain-containing protein [Bacteroidota bacterium]